MSSIRDPYCYEHYYLSSYVEQGGPPLIHKRSRLLAAVVQNQVGVLQDLLDSPEWYNVTDKNGLTLLQVAIRTYNKEVFDYMLSLPDFPIDFVNENGQTALDTAFDLFLDNEVLDISIVEAFDYPPLEVFFTLSRGIEEIVPALLMHGATPTVCAFEMSFRRNAPCFIQEMLFLYIFDQYSHVDLSLQVILKMAERKSFLFHELLKHKFTVNIDASCYGIWSYLIKMDIDFLRIIIEKFSSKISQVFARVGFHDLLDLPPLNNVTCLENLELILHSDLRSDVISIISAVGDHWNLTNWTPIWTEIYCYLLSYGLTISDYQLSKIYAKNGRCELFKILLHMDINFVKTKKSLWPAIFYDVSLNIEHFFKHPDQYEWDSDTVKKLCKYFAHPRLTELYAESIGDSSEILVLPQVPLLTELARNVFRKYFIKTFQIQTSRRFYTLLNSLPISTVYKKIISYDRELYGIF